MFTAERQQLENEPSELRNHARSAACTLDAHVFQPSWSVIAFHQRTSKCPHEKAIFCFVFYHTGDTISAIYKPTDVKQM